MGFRLPAPTPVNLYYIIIGKNIILRDSTPSNFRKKIISNLF